MSSTILLNIVVSISEEKMRDSKSWMGMSSTKELRVYDSSLSFAGSDSIIKSLLNNSIRFPSSGLLD